MCGKRIVYLLVCVNIEYFNEAIKTPFVYVK